jgi:hypothetical protein
VLKEATNQRNAAGMQLGTRILPISFFGLFFDPENGDVPKRRLSYNGQHNVVSQKMG